MRRLVRRFGASQGHHLGRFIGCNRRLAGLAGLVAQQTEIGCCQRKLFRLTFRSTSLARQALLSVLTALPGSPPRLAPSAGLAAVEASRSEEHTSELQS